MNKKELIIDRDQQKVEDVVINQETPEMPSQKKEFSQLILTADKVIEDPAYKNLESYDLSDPVTSRRLVFEGVRHAGDPHRVEEDARMMEHLKTKFDQFAASCREIGSKPLVIVEGGHLEAVPAEESEARKNEMNFVAFLAKKAEIPCISPEPTDLEQAEHLLQRGYAPEQVLSTFVLRQLKHRVSLAEGEKYSESTTSLVREHISLLDHLHPSWELSKGKFPKATYRESIQTWFEYMQSLSGEARAVEEKAFKEYAVGLGEAFTRFVLSEMKKTDGVDVEPVIEEGQLTVEAQTIADYTHLDDPAIRARPTNKIFNEIQRFRDEKIVTEIAKAKEEGKDVFVVFGSYHATAQKPALQSLYS